MWEAPQYRDCLCSIMIRDYESHCQDNDTYYEPERYQERFTCDYLCANGGRKARNVNYCRCVSGYSGRCCTQGKFVFLYSQISDSQNTNLGYLPEDRDNLRAFLFANLQIIYLQAQSLFIFYAETPLCGKLFLEPEGIIATPNFPNQYPKNRRCVWQIATDSAKRIALGVKDGAFSIQEGSSINTCDRDYVTVYDGNSKDSKKIGPFCGNTSRSFQTIHSTGHHLYVEFQSDRDIQYSGFQLQYITYRVGMRCGPRQEYSLPTAIITSPQYPLMHKTQEMCEYEISIMPRHELILTTLHMNLPASADCLQGDVIEIMKKSSVSSDYKKQTVLCGRENYARLIIHNSSHVLLKLSSGFINGGQFKLRYEQIQSPLLL